MYWELRCSQQNSSGSRVNQLDSNYEPRQKVDAMQHRKIGLRRSASRAVIGLLLAACLGTISFGCQGYQRDVDVISEVRAGEFGAARMLASNRATRNPSDRSYMLDRLKVMLLEQADGVPQAAESSADALYDFLRTQGVNRDNTVTSFFIGEQGARFWKGEPFEQAMTYHAIAVFDATRGDWGNVRAGVTNSLFSLRDFSRTLANVNSLSTRRDTSLSQQDWSTDPDTAERVSLLKTAAKAEKNGSADGLATYTPARSDFEIGYAMRAIASRQLGLREDMNESVAALSAMRPEMATLASTIASGRYNTILIVDYGLAPRKVGTGPDNAIAVFRPVTASDSSPLNVRVAASSLNFPVTTDVNRLARDLKWNNLEDLRRAKSLIGDVLIVGGAAVALGAKDDEAKLAGAAVAIAGLIMKATSAADTRHCEVLPQRVYIAPIWLEPGLNMVELSIGGRARLVIPDVPGPPAGRVFARYARLNDKMGPWATSGVVRYSNDVSGETRTPATVGINNEQGVPFASSARLASLPYILGGACVRVPTDRLLTEYQQAGFLRGVSLNDLVDLYKSEEIWIDGLSPEPGPRRHILEGGSSLFTPEAGSTGFVRLFCQQHQTYSPRSSRVQELAAQIRVQLLGGETVAQLP